MGVPVTGTITTTAPSDVYATIDTNSGIGSKQEWDTIAERNSITLQRRRFGMLVTVKSDPSPANNKTYILANIALGGVDNDLNNNSNWIEFSGGGGGGGYSLPIARYVYLVNDSSDQTRMGGTSSEVFTTFQAAYDRANTIQVALGGTLKVGIKVGTTVAATVGGVTLAANWNQHVVVIGDSPTTSLLGSVVGNNTANAFAINITAFNCNISTITAESTSAGNGGAITINGNAIIGNVSTQSLGSSGSGGTFSINSSSLNGVIGNINTSSANGAGGNITLNSRSVVANITMVCPFGNTGNCVITNSICGTITMTHTGVNVNNLTISGSVTGAITINNNSTASNSGISATISNSVINTFRVNEGSSATTRTHRFSLSNLQSIRLDKLSSNATFISCIIDLCNIVSSISFNNNYTGSDTNSKFSISSVQSKSSNLTHTGNDTGYVSIDINLKEFTTTSSPGITILTGATNTTGATGNNLDIFFKNVSCSQYIISNIDGYSSMYVDNSFNFNTIDIFLGDSNSGTNGPSNLFFYNNYGITIGLTSSGFTGEEKNIFLNQNTEGSLDYGSLNNNESTKLSLKDNSIFNITNSSSITLQSANFITTNADYNFGSEDPYGVVEFISVDTSSSNRIVDIPSAINSFNREISIQKTSASNSITVNIVGSFFTTITTISTETYKSNGISWIKIN